MKLNLKVRFRNPIFVAQFLLALLTPILAYTGLTAQDITTWGKLGEIVLGAISNPYVATLVVVSVFNAINDPTTTGITDSGLALTYHTPRKED